MTRTVLITGTSSGLGRAAARLFQSKGWNVVATMRNPGAETELNSLDRVLVTRLDVEDGSSITPAIEAGIARFGAIDVLVNNAGFGAFGPLESTPIETIRRQFEVNVIGVLQTMRAILPHFRARRAGTIVNVTSTSGRMTLPFGSLYHGSKYAVEGVTEALQYELSPLGIRVKLVEPGAIRTDFAGRSISFNNQPEIAEYQPLLTSSMNTYGGLMATSSEPELIAQQILAAAEDESSKLRFPAGDDAFRMIAARGAASDEEYFASTMAQFGLAARAGDSVRGENQPRKGGTISDDDLHGFYRRYIEALNARRFDVVAEMVHDEVSVNGVPHERDDVLASLRGLTDAVPDYRWNVQDLLVVGDRIAARLRDTGTPAKTFLGHEATGAAIDVMEFASYRVVDGRFAEMWFSIDAATAAEQLRRLR